MSPTAKTSCLARLRRGEGQVRGIARMVTEDRYCIDILTQLRAVREALKRVEDEILKDHVTHCVEDAVASADTGRRRRVVAELVDVLERR